MEVALLLPLVAVLALAIAQVALVARDRVLLTHAARVGARVAAVGGSDDDVRREVAASAPGSADRLRVEVHRTATTVEVRIGHRSITDLPLVGAFVDDVELVAVARMPREPP